MEKKDRHRRILILMILSQLLLTGFVVQWLFSQYNGEKETLVKELRGFYVESQDEIIDTLLLRSYVHPVLSENRIVVMDHLISGKDSSLITTTSISTSPGIKRKAKWNNSEGIITVNLKGGCDTVKITPDTLKVSRLPDEMLLRSVRLIVARSEDTLNMKHQTVKNFPMNLDTAMFKKHFHTRLTNTGMKFDIEWRGDTSLPVHEKGKRMLLIDPLSGSSLPEAAVAGYNGYLIGKMLPQIIFGIVLVFITALAFVLSYRSIRSHIILNSLRNEFVNNITHELKTPVATLRVALESLSKFNMREEPGVMEEYLKLASVETQRLEELINRVLDHSLLDEYNHPLDFKITDINMLVNEVADTMKQRIENRGRLEVRHDAEKNLVKCDPLYLKGVLSNLLDNSIKYCNREPVIIIESGAREGHVVIEVQDNGPGIPVEYQKKIFEKFFRLPSENIHNVKGYGLGLSFASQVMKHHNGSIEVRNLEQGCSFIIKIPVA